MNAAVYVSGSGRERWKMEDGRRKHSSRYSEDSTSQRGLLVKDGEDLTGILEVDETRSPFHACCPPTAFSRHSVDSSRRTTPVLVWAVYALVIIDISAVMSDG